MALVVLNGVDWAAFEILNVNSYSTRWQDQLLLIPTQIGNRQITYLSPGIEVVDGLFQALAVRSGGFYVVPIPSIRISLQGRLLKLDETSIC